ncbi:MAG: hypothetical protein EB090_04185, partial [Verrucomicrobia bacterium]|nr:hypothetical protein [Verrucomicrobiota bacterium]
MGDWTSGSLSARKTRRAIFIWETDFFGLGFFLMPEITSSQLAPSHQEAFRKAKDALNRQNTDYILMLL